MLARDVMSEGVLTIADTATVYEAAEMMVNARVSAVPVVDPIGNVIGIVSEADLIRRLESSQSQSQSGLMRRLHDDIAEASTFVRSNAMRVGDVMTKEVVTADENVVIGDVAGLMLRHRIKRVPITRRGRLVGVVSRINLLKAMISHGPPPAAAPPPTQGPPRTDDQLRSDIDKTLKSQSWSAAWPVDIVASAGAVHLWGVVPDASVREAYRVAVEKVPGVASVVLHMHVVPSSVRTRR